MLEFVDGTLQSVLMDRYDWFPQVRFQYLYRKLHFKTNVGSKYKLKGRSFWIDHCLVYRFKRRPLAFGRVSTNYDDMTFTILCEDRMARTLTCRDKQYTPVRLRKISTDHARDFSDYIGHWKGEEL